MRSDPGIFNFVKWLRVGEEACPTLEQAKARLRELYPSKRMAVNAAANRKAPRAGGHPHRFGVLRIGASRATSSELLEA